MSTHSLPEGVPFYYLRREVDLLIYLNIYKRGMANHIEKKLCLFV